MITKIPPEHIYAIDNQKVISNEIDKIETGVKSPQIISDTKNVYNETITEDNSGVFYDGTPQDDTGSWGFVNSSFGNVNRVGANIAYVKLEPKYVTKTIIIPRNITNSRITNLLTLTDKNGSSNIKYSLSGEVKTGTQTASAYVYIPVNSSNVQLSNFVLNEPSGVVTSLQSYIIPTNEVSITERHEFGGLGGSSIPATASVTLNDLTNVSTATEDKYSGHFEITLTILSGLKIIACKGYYDSPNYGTATLSGTYEEYIPAQVTISFYGDTISLNLEDNTITLGVGKDLISFSGNELIQSTNTPSPKISYQKVIDKWKNGKEVAKIKCGIADFYDINEEATITILSSSTTTTGYRVKFMSNVELNSTTTLIKDNIIIKNIVNIDGSYFGITEGFPPIEYGTPEVYTAKTMTVSISAVNGLPMTLKIGDIVVPYVYTTKGVEPMSYYEDNSPKQFRVLGKGISYSGRAFQTLTLQEVAQN